MWFQMCQSVYLSQTCVQCNEDCVRSELPDLVVQHHTSLPSLVLCCLELDTAVSWPCVDKDMPCHSMRGYTGT